MTATPAGDILKIRNCPQRLQE
nr:unnamed protein product [Callosobruchus analis]